MATNITGMDFGLSEAIAGHKVEVGDKVWRVMEPFIDSFQHHNPVVDNLTKFLEGIVPLLTILPPVYMVVIFGVGAYLLSRRWVLAVGTVIGFVVLLNLGFWQTAMETLSLVVSASLVCLLIAIPLGTYLARHPKSYKFFEPVLDMMQVVPTFVYLIPALVLFGLGMVPGIFATVIFVVPTPVRLVYTALSSVPKSLQETADSFGATKWQRLRLIDYPYALPFLLQALNQTIMLSLSMVVIAALVGAAGLGVPVVRALNQVNVGMGVEGGLAIVIVAIIMDRLLRSLSSRTEK
ncbi:MAG: ABC transporter permease subunit [Alphaproteobacteria bacterium]|nr:ABC transporter permease subunit [Alphaproteobacteria bacterium]